MRIRFNQPIEFDPSDNGRVFSEIEDGWWASWFNETARYIVYIEDGRIACLFYRDADNSWKLTPYIEQNRKDLTSYRSWYKFEISDGVLYAN